MNGSSTFGPPGRGVADATIVLYGCPPDYPPPDVSPWPDVGTPPLPVMPCTCALGTCYLHPKPPPRLSPESDPVALASEITRLRVELSRARDENDRLRADNERLRASRRRGRGNVPRKTT